jgi:hypothetical protein
VFQGATTLSIITLSITTLSITTLSITTLSMTTLSILTLSKVLIKVAQGRERLLKGRLSTADLLIKVACFVKK